jgi:NAD(P)-dependent dehydrogenase (short-subunit alcohol dehydrogenase family)
VGVSGKKVVVTGAARGIGRAVAASFAGAGASVVGLDRSWDDEPPFTAATVDITDRAAVRACADRVGAVDVLVNNAARRQRDIFPPEGIVTVLETSDADWQSMFDVNVGGTLNVVRAFVPQMIARGRGSIVTVGTRGSVLLPAGEGAWRHSHPEFRNQPYDATKAAQCSLSLYLAEELREHGIAVNVVFPGPTYTTGSDAIVAGRRAAGVDARPFLRPEHLVPVLLHLAEQTADGDTGLAIDSLQWNRDHGHGDTTAWYYDAVSA